MPESDLLTDRLRLRLMDARDAALYRELYADAGVMAAIGPPLPSEVADAAFERVCRHNRCPAPGHRAWTVERLDGTPLGLVALHRRGRSAELGIMFRPDGWNRGFGREAFQAVITYGFGQARMSRIEVECRDPAQAVVLGRLVGPLGFRRMPASAPAVARWSLHPGDALDGPEVGNPLPAG